MAGNMEAMLLESDDSDSDDNSEEEVMVGGTVQVPVAAPIPINIAKPQPDIAVMPDPLPVTALPAPLTAPIRNVRPMTVNVPAPVPAQNVPMPLTRNPPPNIQTSLPVNNAGPGPGPQIMNRTPTNASMPHNSRPRPPHMMQRASGAPPVGAHPPTNPMQPAPHQQANPKNMYQYPPNMQPSRTYNPNSNAPPISNNSIEPTSIREIQAKNNQRMQTHPMKNRIQQQQQQQQQQRPIPQPQPVMASSQQRQSQSSAQRARYPVSQSQQVSKARKEQFLMFTRVLMKYLEQKDVKMHSRAKEVIRECAKKNKDGNPQFASLSASMQAHLKKLVGAAYWKKAEEYLKQYMTQQFVKHQGMPVEDAKKKATVVAKAAASSFIPQQQERKPPRRDEQVPKPFDQEPPQTNPAPIPTPNPEPRKDLKNIPKREPTKPKKKKADRKPGKKTAKVRPSPTNTKTKKTERTKPPETNTPRTKVVVEPPPKEYSDGTEMLDHVVDYDVKSCAVILGSDSKRKAEVSISEEQNKMLYHDFGITKIGPRKGLYGGQVNDKEVSKSNPSAPTSSLLPSYLKGWDERNIVSSRAAWSKLRLMEEESLSLVEQDMLLPSGLGLKPSSQMNVVKVQSNDSVQPVEEATALTKQKKTDWFNEGKAEEDKALALISEATQQYIKTILEGAMNSANQRLNLDGIRLWHQQHAIKEAQMKATTDKPKDPPLHLRLGCDTRRQYSLVQGNAAKTYQRLEEALSRQPQKELNTESMYNATSMAELSKIPKLSGAAAKASYNAKRIFEIHGGKESGDPPLGRVPKKARIMIRDFRHCLNEPSFAMSRKRVASRAFV